MLTPSIGKNQNVPPAVFVTRGLSGWNTRLLRTPSELSNTVN